MEPQASLTDVQSIDRSIEKNTDHIVLDTAESARFSKPRAVPDYRNDDENGTILSSLSKMDTRPESFCEVRAMKVTHKQ